MKDFKSFLTESDNGEEDLISMNVPLLLRVMEWSREDAKKDVDLHVAIENMLDLMKDSDFLTMDDYEDIVYVSDEEDSEEDY